MKEIDKIMGYYSDEFDIHIEPYIPAQTVIDIAETAMTMANQMEQKICIAINVIRECTDADIDGALDNLDVDTIMYCGLWDEVKDHIKNVHEIYSYIAHAENNEIAIAKFLNVTLPNFLNSIDEDLTKYIKKLPKGKEWDDFIKDAPKAMQEILDAMQRDGNADIIRGAFAMNDTEKVDDSE